MRAFAAVVLITLLGAVQAPAQRGGGGRGGGGHSGMGGGFRGHGGGFRGHSGFGHHPGVVVTVPPFRDFGSRTGFGNILAPGVGNLPPLEPNQFFAHRFGASVSGFPGFRGSKGDFPVYPLYNYPIYSYPAFDPYAYGYGNYAQPAAPNVTIVVPPQAAAPPVNIYEQPEPAQPMIREYPPYGEERGEAEESSVRTYRAPSPSRPSPPPEDIRFLIPLKDNSVYSAVAYWVEGDTLHYITTDGRHNQVSIDLVDRAVAERLNRGGRAEFRLPPPKK